MKTCSSCGLTQPESEFYASRKTGRRRAECRTCVKAYVTKWQRENKDKHSRYVRSVKLRAEYGLTPDDYQAMLRGQDGGCAICRQQPPEGQNLAVDHCHQTGRVRGLLCNPCNQALGHFRDSPERLRKAAAYLSRSMRSS